VGAVGAFFFLSGASALVYQVAWQRILALHSGVGIYSIAMIVAAFMAGLGVGSRWGGVLSPRLGPRAALLCFAGLEIGIAAFGLLSVPLYYDALYVRAGWLYTSPWRAGALHFAGLLVPTALMGMSLPFLVRAVVVEASGAGRRIGFLYGINTLGAAAGALAAPWILIRHFGIDGAVRWAALGNVMVALGAFVLAHVVGAEAAAGAEEDDAAAALDAADAPTASDPDAPAGRPFGLWLALYALSGFCALSLEIVWFRLVDVVVRSWAFTFGTVLAIYLLGSAVGSLAGTRLMERGLRPLRAFLLCQCGLLVYSGAAVLLLYLLPPDTPGYAWYYQYWRGYDGFKLGQEWDWDRLLRLYVVMPTLLYGLPTVLMGVSFPILQHAVHDDPKTSGRKVGFLQAANIAGCVAGSLIVGLVFLTTLGTTGTLRVLMAGGLVFALLGLRYYGAQPAFLAAAVASLALMVGLPGQERFWLKLHGRQTEAGLVDEDATGVGTVTENPATPGDWHLSCNGKGQGAVPFFDGHVVMGSVPALIHPHPTDIALIGLGTGGTAWAAACRPETKSVHVFELFGPQQRLLQRFAATSDYAPLHALLKDPRVAIRVEDGRNALSHDERLYDIIEADPIFPDRAYSGNLYSLEFLERVARRLKPGGLFCSWGPTPRIYSAFHQVFPHVVGLDNRMLLIGSRDEIPLDVETWLARLGTREVTDYLGFNNHEEVYKRLRKIRVQERKGHREFAVNRDLFPRDEFLTPYEASATEGHEQAADGR
jgi:predicted membrane-bound spermidine synthase